VVCLGYAFTYDVSLPGYRGLLGGRRAVVITTGSADPDTYPEAWQREAQEKLVPEVLRTAGIDTISRLSLTQIHRYAPSDDLTAALQTVAAFARTL